MTNPRPALPSSMRSPMRATRRCCCSKSPTICWAAPKAHPPGFDSGRDLEHNENIDPSRRSEEHTSALQSLMRNSYAVFCLEKKTKNTQDKDKSKTKTYHSINKKIYDISANHMTQQQNQQL